MAAVAPATAPPPPPAPAPESRAVHAASPQVDFPAPERPLGHWEHLPPLHTLGAPTPVLERRFDADLVSWQNPAFGLSPLGHLRLHDAPHGVVQLEGHRLPAPPLAASQLGTSGAGAAAQPPMPQLVLRSVPAPKKEEESSKSKQSPSLFTPPALHAQPAAEVPPPPPPQDPGFVRAFSETPRRFPDTVSRYAPPDLGDRPSANEGTVAQLGVAPALPTVIYRPARIEAPEIAPAAPPMPVLSLALPPRQAEPETPVTKGKLRMGEPLDQDSFERDVAPPPPADTVQQAPPSETLPPAAETPAAPDTASASPVVEAGVPAPAAVDAPSALTEAAGPQAETAPVVAPVLSDLGDPARVAELLRTLDLDRPHPAQPPAQRLDLATRPAPDAAGKSTRSEPESAPRPATVDTPTQAAAPPAAPPPPPVQAEAPARVAPPPPPAPPAARLDLATKPADKPVTPEHSAPAYLPPPPPPLSSVELPVSSVEVPAPPPPPAARLDLATKPADKAVTREHDLAERADTLGTPDSSLAYLPPPPPVVEATSETAATTVEFAPEQGQGRAETLPSAVVEAAVQAPTVREIAPLISQPEPLTGHSAPGQTPDAPQAPSLPFATSQRGTREAGDQPVPPADVAALRRELATALSETIAPPPLSRVPQAPLEDMPVATRPAPRTTEAHTETAPGAEVSIETSAPAQQPEVPETGPTVDLAPPPAPAGPADASLLGERSLADLGLSLSLRDLGLDGPTDETGWRHPGDGGQLVLAERRGPSGRSETSRAVEARSADSSTSSVVALAPQPQPRPDPVAPLVGAHPQLAQLSAESLLARTPTTQQGAGGTPASLTPLQHGVRVRTGADVDQAARDMKARAFTRDGDIHLSAKSLQRGSQEVDALIAHEMTHVLQQRALGRDLPSPGTAEYHMLEAEAQAVERATLLGMPLPSLNRWHRPEPQRPADNATSDLTLANPAPTVIVQEVAREPERTVLSEWRHPAFDDELVQLAEETAGDGSSTAPAGAGFDHMSDVDLSSLFALLYPMIEARMKSDLRRHRDRAGQVNQWDMR